MKLENFRNTEKYCTDGYSDYIDIVYPGKHVRNARNKSDIFTVEGRIIHPSHAASGYFARKWKRHGL